MVPSLSLSAGGGTSAGRAQGAGAVARGVGEGDRRIPLVASVELLIPDSIPRERDKGVALWESWLFPSLGEAQLLRAISVSGSDHTGPKHRQRFTPMGHLQSASIGLGLPLLVALMVSTRCHIEESCQEPDQEPVSYSASPC